MANSARDGTVYMTATVPSTGPESHRDREISAPSGMAMAAEMATASMVSPACSSVRCHSRGALSTT